MPGDLPWVLIQDRPRSAEPGSLRPEGGRPVDHRSPQATIRPAKVRSIFTPTSYRVDVDFLRTLSGTGCPAFITDDSRRIVGLNEAAEQLLGYSGSEVVGRLCDQLFCGRDASGNPLCGENCPIRSLVRRNRPVPSVRMRVKNASGNDVAATLSIVLLPGSRPEHSKLLHLLMPATSQGPEGSDEVGENGETRVFLVDDLPVVREGLARLIGHEPDLAICGGAGDAPSAVRGISTHTPDLAVVDLSLRAGSWIDLIKRIHTQHPDLPILAYSMLDEPLHAERALRAGARGFLTKRETGETLLKAIRCILSGEMYVSSRLSTTLIKRLLVGGGREGGDPVESLSDRELEVFQMIGDGRGTKEIATTLNLSVKTIETYREHVKTKLGLKDSRELAIYALRWECCPSSLDRERS